MSFKRMSRRKYPRRLWSLFGPPGSGKSTFAAAMRAPILPVDADNRFEEIEPLVAGVVYELSSTPADNVDPDAIARILGENMPRSDVATIVVDSLTAILTPLIASAMVAKDAGRSQNLAAEWRKKALAMRLLQDSLTKWGTDVLWIYHVDTARDAQAQAVTRASISQTELARLTRSINLQLQIVQKGARRGIKIVWARRGRLGMTLWDESGRWIGMPERIEEAVYAGLSQDEQDRLEQDPDVFPNPETAIAWAVEEGAFEALAHSRSAYEKLRLERRPGSAREMTALWKDDVRQRLAAQADIERELAEGPVEAAEETPEPSSAPSEADGTQDNRPESEEPAFICAECGRAITPFRANGKSYSISALIDICNNFTPPRRPTCGPCLQKIKKGAQAGKARIGEGEAQPPPARNGSEPAASADAQVGAESTPAADGAAQTRGLSRAETRGDLLNALQALFREAHDLSGGDRYNNPHIRRKLLREYDAKSLTELTDEQILQLTGTVRDEIAAMKAQPAGGERPEPVGEPVQAEMPL
jgi:hypothetical protein